MKTILPLLVMLLALPLQGDITSLVKTPAAAGGCNAFAETTWDNLTGWTQSSFNDFSADSSNDELDMGALEAGAVPWIRNSTATSSEDHCVLWQYKDIASNMDGIHLGLRMPSGTGNFYAVGYDFSDPNWWWMAYNKPSGDASYVDTNQSTSGAAPNDGDYISACVDGTGTGTVVTIWDHGGSDPGDCRTDWGAADITFTDNPSTAVNTNSAVGLVVDNWSGGTATAGSFDEFVGSDY